MQPGRQTLNVVELRPLVRRVGPPAVADRGGGGDLVGGHGEVVEVFEDSLDQQKGAGRVVDAAGLVHHASPVVGKRSFDRARRSAGGTPRAAANFRTVLMRTGLPFSAETTVPSLTPACA